MIATSLDAVQAMHEWVREFFGAHCAKLNCTKTELLCSSNLSALENKLFSVDGKTPIKPHGPSHTIRYLGVWLNLNLQWKTQITRMSQTIHSVCASILRGSFTIPMSVFAITQFLIPRLRAALRVVTIRDEQLRAWDDKILRTVRKADGITMGPLNRDAFFVTTGIPSLEAHRWLLRGESMMVALNSSYPAALTCQARWAVSMDSCCRSRVRDTWKALVNNLGAEIKDVEGEHSDTPLRMQRQGPWQSWLSSCADWNPYRQPILNSLSDGWSGGVIGVYTDGSTAQSTTAPSGYAAVLTLGTDVIGSFGGACRTSGNNFLAEAVAVLYALHLTPSQAPLLINIDSEACIGAINKCRVVDWHKSFMGSRTNDYMLPQRARAISAGRPVLNMIRAMMTMREGSVTLKHVRSHTLRKDFASRMNDLADKEANRARLAHPEDTVFPVWLFGEDRFRIVLDNFPVVGSYGKALRRCLENIRFRKWKNGGSSCSPGANTKGGGRDKLPDQALRVKGFQPNFLPAFKTPLNPLKNCGPHQRRLARSAPGIHGLLKAIMKSRDPMLRRVYALALMEYLPVERRLMVAKKDAGRGEACKRCGLYVESLRHVFVCNNLFTHSIRRACTLRCVDILREAKVTVVRSNVSPGPPIGVADGFTSWERVWFDISNEFWMQVWTAEYPDQKPCVRDRLGDVLGVLPKGIADRLDRCWQNEGWHRRVLGSTYIILEKLRLEIIDAAVTTYIDRCVTMDKWWKSDAAILFRTARNQQLAERRKRNKSRTLDRQMKRFLSKKRKRRAAKLTRSVSNNAPIKLASYPLTRNRGKRVCYTPDYPTVQEYVAEYTQKYAFSHASNLPWF